MIRTDAVCCDLCGSCASRQLYKLSDTYFNIPGEFLLQECTSCGLVYLSPRPTSESLGDFYPDQYDNYQDRAVADERFFLMRWMRQQKLTQRRRFVERQWGRTPGRLLDVGCSTGLFLNEMQEQGWEVLGLEPSSQAACYARERFDVTVWERELLAAPISPSSLDVVTFWDVLEHTFSPREQLDRVAQLLKPGGAVVISVPNWSSLDRRVFGEFWQGLDPPRHLYVFSELHLKSYLEQTGFELTHSACFMPAYFSFAMSVERWLQTIDPSLASGLARLLAVPGIRFPLMPWFSLLNVLKKGPILTIFARKVSDDG